MIYTQVMKERINKPVSVFVFFPYELIQSRYDKVQKTDICKPKEFVHMERQETHLSLNTLPPF